MLGRGEGAFMGEQGRQEPARVLVGQLGSRVGDQVRVCGWVQTLRLQRRMQFVVLRDETGAVQLTNRREVRPGLDEQLDALTVGSAVALTGRVVDAPQVKLGGIEVLVDSVDLVATAEQPLPIAETSNVDLRLDWRFLDLRAPRQHLTFTVGDLFEQSMRSFLKARRFTELHTPKLMGAASESGAEVFRVDYFGSSAYLAQSPQFYKQMAIAAGFDRVMEVGPVFRAEPSFTSRHSTEFTGLDLEMAWIDSVDDVMRMEEEMLAAAIAAVRDALGREVEETFGVNLAVPLTPFPRMTLAEAREQLFQAGWQPGERASQDLDGEGERLLSKLVADKFGHQFVFVTDYPVSVRPFYHMRPDGDPTVTSSFDLIWNGLEVTTGAQREHRYDVLVAQAAEKAIPLEPISHYVNCFRYGCPPHGGLGIGVSRLLMKLLDLPSIREASLFFRGPNRLTP
jgi:nondiscriminating aspartyl-tRNA synthetase